MLHKRFPLIVACELRNRVAHVLGLNKALVSHNSIVYDALAYAQMIQVEFIGLYSFYNRSGHICLVFHSRYDVILVLDLGFHDVPTHADGLVAQVNHLRCCALRVNQHIVLVGIVFVGSNVQLIVALGQLDGVEAVSPTCSLCHECTCDGVTHYDFGACHMGLFIGVVGEFIGDVHHQCTC